MKTIIVVAIILVSLLPHSVRAEDQCPDKPPGKLEDFPPSQLIKCIVDLKNALAAVRRDISSSAGGRSSINIPSGAVVAFYLTKCPDGWDDFGLSMGRTIVGAKPEDWTGGSQTAEDGTQLALRKSGDLGGRESYTLSPQNIPTLTTEPMKLLGMAWSPSPAFLAVGDATTGSASVNAGGRSLTIPNSNGPKAVPTMPPFLSLIYCRRR